jgi:hypothetical protein
MSLGGTFLRDEILVLAADEARKRNEQEMPSVS